MMQGGKPLSDCPDKAGLWTPPAVELWRQLLTRLLTQRSRCNAEGDILALAQRCVGLEILSTSLFVQAPGGTMPAGKRLLLGVGATPSIQWFDVHWFVVVYRSIGSVAGMSSNMPFFADNRLTILEPLGS